MILRPLRFLALAAGLSAAISACASVFGFEEGAELPDGGLDAGFHASADSTATIFGTDAGDEGDTEFNGDALGGALSEGDAQASLPVTCGAAAVCVPQAPGGWQGPYAIIESAGVSPLPALLNCPTTGYSQEVYTGTGAPIAPAATCTCACGAPGGGACAPPTLNYVTKSPGCSPCAAAVPMDGGCTPLNYPGGPSGGCSMASIGGATVAASGACVPDASAVVPPAQWSAEARLCGVPGAPVAGSCAAGQVCAPAAGLPVKKDTYCVAINSVSQCPSAYYAVARQYYTGDVDTRACTACSCEPATGSACPNSAVYTYTDLGCTSAHGTLPAPVACSSFPSARAVSFNGGAPTGGSCAPDGGRPTGTFAPTNPYTVCCNQ
jgi:hypothetical protein